jgi:hypothetical protein
VVALALGAALAIGTAHGEPVVFDDGVLTIDDSGLRYTYQPLTGEEGLFDVSSDPLQLRNLVRERPAESSRLRGELEQRLHVESLEDIRRAKAETIERLKAFGYL